MEFIEGVKYKDFGFPMSLAELCSVFDEADRDKPGNLSYHEFATMFLDKQKALSVANIKKAFMEIDKNDDNCLTKDDVAGINGMEQLIYQIDNSKDGKITLEKFIAFRSTGK